MIENKQIEGILAKRFKTVLDIAAIPNGMDVATWVKLADSGYIFYDSTKGRKPTLYSLDDMDTEVVPTFTDVSGEVVELSVIQATWVEQEKWRRELHNCKQSPIYFYANYAAPEAKPTQEQMDEFLASINIKPKDDSSEVMQESAKKARLEFAEGITLEKIQGLKILRDEIILKYDAATNQLLEEAYLKYGLSTIDAVKKVVFTEIMKTPTKSANELLRSFINDKTGRWDLQMFRATDFDIVLRAWITIQ
jgi:hypothetical protein